LPIVLALLGSPLASGEEKAPRVRDVIRTKLPQNVAAVALEYTIVLLKNGQERAVDPNEYRFAIGDQFLVRIEAKDDMYIYVFTEGPTGNRSRLLPDDNEKPPKVSKDAKVELPGDGYFQFTAPPGEEKFIVVATLEPSQNLQALSRFVYRQNMTQQQQDNAKEENKVLEENVKTLQSEFSPANLAKKRGILNDATLRDFSADLKRKKRGSLEEPPHGDEKSTFALAVSEPEAGKPKLLVNISLKSQAARANKTP
jgi:hypothetical protein